MLEWLEQVSSSSYYMHPPPHRTCNVVVASTVHLSSSAYDMLEWLEHWQLEGELAVQAMEEENEDVES